MGKERIQFDTTTEQLQRLEEMKVMTEAASNAEVIRNALKVYEWFAYDAGYDSEIQVKNASGEVILRTKTSIFLK